MWWSCGHLSYGNHKVSKEQKEGGTAWLIERPSGNQVGSRLALYLRDRGARKSLMGKEVVRLVLNTSQRILFTSAQNFCTVVYVVRPLLECSDFHETLRHPGGSCLMTFYKLENVTRDQ